MKTNVLTVSYGNLSCSLEDFDGAFDALKPIAEYLYDLTEENPGETPDMDLLVEIAERMGASGIAAEVEGDRIVLVSALVDEDLSIEDERPDEMVDLAQDEETEAVDAPDTTEDVDVHEVVEETPAPESIAERLSRIRAVVAQQTDEPKADLDEVEAEDDEPEDLISATTRDLEAALQHDDAAVENVLSAESAEDDTEKNVLGVLSTVSETDEKNATDQLEDADLIETAEADEALEEAVEEPAEEPQEDEAPIDELSALLSKRADAPASEDNIFVEEEAPAPAPKKAMSQMLRAMKAKQMTDDAPLATKAVEPVENDMDQRDVTEAEEQIAEDVEPENVEVGRTPTRPRLEVNADDVNRLMDEAETQMGEPESSSRRSAFAHLKAAVAARRADRKITDDTSRESGDGAYRSDLESVVRPRRPNVSVGEFDESNAKKPPTPLTLVAEQRVDASDTPDANRVKSRAVGGGFADFAHQMEADHMPDLLEAAASYMSFVEGQEQFSRPQLMSKAREARSVEFSREDGLRSFGQLLRTGKITKVEGGRFSVTSDIGFRPGTRAAG
ncbi:MAG: hypothetical protein ACFB11_11460 [Paracoccaceae bacterium]